MFYKKTLSRLQTIRRMTCIRMLITYLQQNRRNCRLHTEFSLISIELILLPLQVPGWTFTYKVQPFRNYYCVLNLSILCYHSMSYADSVNNSYTFNNTKTTVQIILSMSFVSITNYICKWKMYVLWHYFVWNFMRWVSQTNKQLT